LFWAFRPPDDVIKAAAEILHSLETPTGRLGYSVTWARTAALHTTLKFLGEVEPARAPEIIARVQRGMAMQPTAPAILRLRGLGAFPQPERPKVIWLGVAGESESNQGRLLSLARAVEDWMAELGFPREERPYRAHLTLGRVRDRHQPRPARRPVGSRGDSQAPLSPEEWRRGLRDLLASHGDRPVGGAFALKEIVLYESRLGPEAPDYIPLSTVPVGSGK
jgi:2'-5' RNA ligase